MLRLNLDPGPILAFIRDYQTTRGYPPKLADIVAGTGICFWTVRYQVKRLTAAGVLQKWDGRYTIVEEK